MLAEWQLKLAVLYEGQGGIELFEQLATKLNVSIVNLIHLKENNSLPFYITWRNGCLMLLEGASINKPGLTVEIEHRQGEQRSWPMAKQGALAQALGRKTQTIVDATAGWGQDSLAMFRMGYDVISIERFPVMVALLADAYQRLTKLDWIKALDLSPPRLIQGDAIDI
jgi:16S rRNA (guanine1516-N2)-methyltransferase